MNWLTSLTDVIILIMTHRVIHLPIVVFPHDETVFIRAIIWLHVSPADVVPGCTIPPNKVIPVGIGVKQYEPV